MVGTVTSATAASSRKLNASKPLAAMMLRAASRMRSRRAAMLAVRVAAPRAIDSTTCGLPLKSYEIYSFAQ